MCKDVSSLKNDRSAVASCVADGDARSSTYKGILHATVKLGPWLAMYENVPGILHRIKGPDGRPRAGIATIMQDLRAAGRVATWARSNAADFGIKHSRNRVYMPSSMCSGLSSEVFGFRYSQTLADLQLESPLWKLSDMMTSHPRLKPRPMTSAQSDRVHKLLEDSRVASAVYEGGDVYVGIHTSDSGGLQLGIDEIPNLAPNSVIYSTRLSDVITAADHMLAQGLSVADMPAISRVSLSSSVWKSIAGNSFSGPQAIANFIAAIAAGGLRAEELKAPSEPAPAAQNPAGGLQG